MVKPLRVGVIGVGSMGQLHARAIKASRIAELAAVSDRDEGRVRSVADKLDVSYRTTVDEIIDDDSIDAVTIALPDHLHVEPACKVLRSGKPLLLEKPIGHDLEAALEIARTARGSGARLMVAHVLRFDPRYAQAQHVVADGRVGEVLHSVAGRIASRNEGIHAQRMSTLAMHLGVHDADVLQWVVGHPITRVYARTVSKLMPRLDVDREDLLTATLDFANGSIGTLFSGWSRVANDPVSVDGRLEINGTDGCVDVDVRDHGLRVTSDAGVELPDALHWPQVHGEITGDLAAEIRHFCAAVQDGTDFVISVDAALRAVAVGDAINRSLISGQPEAVIEPYRATTTN